MTTAVKNRVTKAIEAALPKNTRSIKEAPAQPHPEAQHVPSKSEQEAGMGTMARGFALAQTVVAMVRNHAKDLHRVATELFNLDDQGRAECIRAIRTWVKQLKDEATKAAGKNEALAIDLNKSANSLATRASQIARIAVAMRAGMTRSTIETHYKRGLDSVGFDNIVVVARSFKSTEARGRPMHAAFVKIVNHAIKMDKFLNDKDQQACSAAVGELLKLAPKFGLELVEKHDKEDRLTGYEIKEEKQEIEADAAVVKASVKPAAKQAKGKTKTK